VEDVPLYQGSTVLLSQAILLLTAFMLSTNTTKEGMQHLLSLLAILLPADNVLPRSKYLFRKFFHNNSAAVKLYCSVCFSPLDFAADALSACCQSCHSISNYNDLMDKGCFFMHLPLVGQLTDLLQTRGLGSYIFDQAKRQKVAVENFEDIYDGQMYKELLMGGTDDLSLTMNCDGVPVFSSSSFSIWPIQCFINELPPAMRKKHVILTGLWFGNIKPVMNTFLEPFVLELKNLGTTGFRWLKKSSAVMSRVYLAVCSCDTVARCMLQNFIQFNGCFGCAWCLHEGEQVKKGSGSKRVYPFQKDKQAELRDVKSTIMNAKATLKNRKPVFGVKGPSQLMRCPKFNIIFGFVVDYMHCVDLGVTRMLANLWLDSRNHVASWYIGTKLDQLNSRMKNIRPPTNITRLPRSFSQRKFWKASEWRAFLIFYSLPVLNGILPTIYLAHLTLLSHAMYLLLQETITPSDLDNAEKLLQTFVSDFENLYGLCNMSYNLHILLHIPYTVKLWGPLWCYSAYGFESFNGVLLKMFNGTQFVSKQIVNSFYLLNNVQCHAATVEMPETIQVKFDAMLMRSVKQFKKATKVDDFVTLIGCCVHRTLDACEKLAIETFSRDYNLNTPVTIYSKAVIMGQLYHSKYGGRSSKRNNFTVQAHSGQSFEILLFVRVHLLSEDSPACVLLVREIIADCSPLVPMTTSCTRSSHTFTVVSTSDTVTAICPGDVKAKYVSVADNLLALLPNNLERD
jgi:hypothetical protein